MPGSTRIHLKSPVYVMQEPVLGNYIAFRGPAPIATAKLHLATIVPATTDCLEKLHVIVNLRNNKLVAECMHVGTRGTYRGAKK